MKVNYVIKDFETTGLPDEDPRHRPYQWAWKMLLVDFDSREMKLLSQDCFFIDPGISDLLVSEYTLKSECWQLYREARQLGMLGGVENPLRAYDRFVEHLLVAKEEGYKSVQVGAAPWFDRQFIDHMQHEREVRHGLRRMICTNQLAAQALHLPAPVSLQESIRRLYDKPCFTQLHTADADVLLCEKILVDYWITPLLQGKRPNPANR